PRSQRRGLSPRPDPQYGLSPGRRRLVARLLGPHLAGRLSPVPILSAGSVPVDGLAAQDIGRGASAPAALSAADGTSAHPLSTGDVSGPGRPRPGSGHGGLGRVAQRDRGGQWFLWYRIRKFHLGRLGVVRAGVRAAPAPP